MIYNLLPAIYSSLDIVHNILLLLSFFSIVRIVTTKVSPYSSIYLGIVLLIQSVYNGCPLSDLQNLVALQINKESIPNQFNGGVFGDFTSIARLFFFCFSLIFLYYSYRTWNKVNVKVNPLRIFGKHFSYSNLFQKKQAI